MEWTVVLAGPARKSLKRIPANDKTRILAALAALAAMQQDPISGRHSEATRVARLPASGW